MMQEALEAKRQFSKIGWLYLFGVALIYAVQTGIVALIRKGNPEWLQNADASVLLSAASMYLVAFPILILFLKRKVPAMPPVRRKMTAGQYALSAIICMGIAYASNFLGSILTMVIGAVNGKPVENQIVSVLAQISPWAVFLYTVVCAPIAEEYLFRKMIVDRTVRYGEGIAVVVSGLMFGLFHGNLNQFVYAFVIGVFLAFLYVKTGNLKITVSLHMLFNFISGFLTLMLMEKLGIAATLAHGDMTALLASMQEKLLWWGLYGLLMLFVFGVMAAGVVLFIVFAVKKKFVLEPGDTGIPKQLKFSLAVGNSGMLAFSIYWVIVIVNQLFL